MACVKVAYKNRPRALAALSRTQNYHLKHGYQRSNHVRRIYKCPRCQQWHLTSKEPRNR